MPRNQKIEPSAPSWQIDNGLVRAGFGWDGVVPGFALDRLDRQEEREQRQLERQREGERQDRAERRYELQFAEAAHWAAIRGEPFDPRNSGGSTCRRSTTPWPPRTTATEPSSNRRRRSYVPGSPPSETSRDHDREGTSLGRSAPHGVSPW